MRQTVTGQGGRTAAVEQREGGTRKVDSCVTRRHSTECA